jgi:hypothetical protein
MAGAFGCQAETYDVSMKRAEQSFTPLSGPQRRGGTSAGSRLDRGSNLLLPRTPSGAAQVPEREKDDLMTLKSLLARLRASLGFEGFRGRGVLPTPRPHHSGGTGDPEQALLRQDEREARRGPEGDERPQPHYPGDEAREPHPERDAERGRAQSLGRAEPHPRGDQTPRGAKTSVSWTRTTWTGKTSSSAAEHPEIPPQTLILPLKTLIRQSTDDRFQALRAPWDPRQRDIVHGNQAHRGLPRPGLAMFNMLIPTLRDPPQRVDSSPKEASRYRSRAVNDVQNV